MLKQKLKAYLKALDEKHLLRRIELPPVDGLSFCSNDYLGFTQDDTLKKCYEASFQKYPMGSTGSLLVSGYQAPHAALLNEFIRAYEVDAALLFPSGYAANLSVMQLFATLQLHVYMDKSVHASFYDGLKLAQGTYTRYLNEPVIKPEHKNHALILTEGVFSMGGRAPNLTELAKHHPNVPLIIDEAHAFGVLGAKGLGAAKAHGLTQHTVPLRVIPLGKALGASGAVVLGDQDWITALLQSARPLIYSTAMSPAFADGLLGAFKHLQTADDAREQLQHNILLFKQYVKQSPFTFATSNTPIQHLKIGCPKKAMALAKKLQEQQIFCVAMREPTVKRQDTGLRMVLNSTHTASDIAYLFECLAQ